MSRIILALALASSVSALLLPRGAAMSTAPLGSSALLSVRSRPLYMSIDPAALTKIAAAGYSAGFSDGQNAAAMLAIAKVEGPSAHVQPADEELLDLATKEFLLAEEKLFERFDTLSPETKESLAGCVEELLATTNQEHEERRTWWLAWQKVKVNADSTDLRAFFEKWLVCAIVPDGRAMLPSEEYPTGVANSPGYFIEKWDWLANTKLGLSLNGFDKEWIAWFVEFLDVRGLFVESKQSFPPAVKAAWEGFPVGGPVYTTKPYTADATGKPGQHPFDISTYLLPSGGFDTFNGFFLRWVRDFATNRPLQKVAEDVEPFTIVSPADGGQFFLSNESTTAGRHTLPGKTGDKFNVVEAFPGYGEKFVGGPLLDQLLWFTDFHHFFAPVSGTLVSMHEYPGSYNYDFDNFDPYHPGLPKPQATSDQAGWYQQLARHKRFVWIFKTEKLGLVGMAAIGFWGVGSIVVDKRNAQTWAGGPNARNDPPPGVPAGKGGDLTPAVKIGDKVKKGSYLGHFGYGGSSIVLAFQPKVNGQALTYNFAATPAGASAPLPIASADASVQVKALEQIGVAFYDVTEE